MKAVTRSNSKARPFFKDLFPACIIVFSLHFMLFIYEPLLMYCTHQNDLWFDLPVMIRPVILSFLIFFAEGIMFFSLSYLIIRLIFKKNYRSIFRMIEIVLFSVVFITFLQGNIFSMYLPALDGSEIDWDKLMINDLFGILSFVAVLGIFFLLLIKRGEHRTVKYLTIAAIGMLIFLTLFLLIEMISWSALRRKDSIITTDRNFSTISEDKNFIILLCDAVGSSEFNSVMEENPEYKEVFEDFTYCPDTLGGYPCTRDSIPLILSGKYNKNEMKFEDYSSSSYNSSPFFSRLTEEGYDINLYEPELIWYGERKFDIKNGDEFSRYMLPLGSFMEEELKYIGYKYLPYIFKKYSYIETMDFNGLVDKFIWDSHTVYGNIIENPVLNRTSSKVFSFIHTEGAHVPFKYDKDLNIIENGTYEQKIESAITLLDAYIKRLKANGTYDNTVIVILADHGNTALNSATDMLVRANPLLMIKGIDEHHPYEESQKPISYGDLTEIFDNLIDGKSAEKSLEYIPDSRQRIYMWYRNFCFENHIEEYAVTGKAWEWEKFEKTGNVYDLN